MGVGGNDRDDTTVKIPDLECVYVDYLRKLPVFGRINKPQRYTFVNMTVSLLEVLIKNEITTEIKKNPKFYCKSWRMILLNGKNEGRTRDKFQGMKNNEDPDTIAEGIPKFFSYQTFYALSSIADTFSCVKDFIEKEFPNEIKFTKHIKKLLGARNNSTHNLEDSLDTDTAVEIRDVLPEFIESAKKIIPTSLEYRQKIQENPTTLKDQRISNAQKQWLDEVDEVIKQKGGCGKCDLCKKTDRMQCKNKVVPGKLWCTFNEKELEFDEKFKNELKYLRSLLK